MDVQQELVEIRSEIALLVTEASRITWTRRIEEWCQKKWQESTPDDNEPPCYWQRLTDLFDIYALAAAIYNAPPTSKEWFLKPYPVDEENIALRRLAFTFLQVRVSRVVEGLDRTFPIDLLVSLRASLPEIQADLAETNGKLPSEDLVKACDLALVAQGSEGNVRRILSAQSCQSIRRGDYDYDYGQARAALIAGKLTGASARLPETFSGFQEALSKCPPRTVSA